MRCTFDHVPPEFRVDEMLIVNREVEVRER